MPAADRLFRMAHIDTYGTTFLASNHNPPEDGFFQGYCFIGSDLVFGTAGAKHYQALTGKILAPGLDGCYVSVRRDSDVYIFDVDFAGYKILYYYHDGQTWVVSNSFAQVVDFLRRQEINIRPNYAHLAAVGGRGMPLGQLFSLETLVQGVKVTPRTHSLIITPHRAMLRRRSTFTAGHDTYEESLSEYINTWVSRFETLMLSDETDFTVDLTGGVDSRTNFALLQAAQRRLGDVGMMPRLRCGSSSANRTDLEVAESVAGRFGLEMNDDRIFGGMKLQGSESYKLYRSLSLGVYHPFYRPENVPTPANITIGGGGGGIHRKTYEFIIKSADPEVFFQQFAKNLRRPEYEEEFIQDARTFLHTAIQDGEDPLRVLLRDGRVRYHSGRTPRTDVAFTPLHSVTAERTQLLAGTDRINAGQFNYDIMNSLEQDLVTMPYDSDAKYPASDVLSRLSRVPTSQVANPGKVWGPIAHLIPQRQVDESRPIDAYKIAFDAALNNPFVLKFWGKNTVVAARDLMRRLDAEKSIGNAANGGLISAVLSADLVTPS